MCRTRDSSRCGLLSHERCEIVHSLEWMNTATAEIGPVTCKRVSRCLPCAMRRTLMLSYLIPQAKASHLVTVRGLPATPKGDLDAMSRLIRGVRRRKGRAVWAWVVEPDSYSTLTHAHAYVRPDAAAAHDELEHVWAASAEACGLNVHVKPYASAGMLDGYAFKKVLAWNRPMTTHTFDARWALAQEALDLHLDLNHGRLVHQSQGFWLDESGDPSPLEQLTRRSPNSAQRVVYPRQTRGEVVGHLRDKRCAQS